jgi:diguanylate cyclase (GGDEF)-like protein
MYDPLVIDTFANVYKDIAPSDEEITAAANSMSAITRGALPPSDGARSTNSRLDDISASTEEMLSLYELARSLSGRIEVTDAADVISKHLRRLVPATTCVFFLYNRDTDELVAAHAAGDNAAHFCDVRIEMGQRLSGWVAANRQTIINSDPMLDLGEVARALRPPLRSCLSTPLLANSDLVGVLTVYSTHRDAFTEDHRRIVEVVARQVSDTIRQSETFRREQTEKLRDELTGLPNRQHLERFVVSELAASSGLPCSILLVEIVPGGTARTATRAVSHYPIAQIAAGVRAGLRGADLLFRYDNFRFVALLTQTGVAAADALARRVAGELANTHVTEDVTSETPAFRIGRATAPDDGTSLSDLIKAAENRLLPPSASPRPSIH